MTQRNFPFKLCMFCYKTVTKDCHHRKANVNKFFLLLKRFVCDIQQKTSQIPSSLDCCRDCEYLVNEYSSVYNEMKSLELQLFLKLKTLEEVMKMADKVSSRVKLVKQYFEEGPVSHEPYFHTNNMEDVNMLGQDKTTQTIFKIMRLEVLKNCQKGQDLLMPLPTVILQRLDKNQVVKSTASSSIFNSFPPPRSTIDDFEDQVITTVKSGTDELDEQMSNESLEICPQTEICNSTDLLVHSESNVESNLLQEVTKERIEDPKQVIVSTNDSAEISIVPESTSSSKYGKQKLQLPKPFSCVNCSKVFTQEKYLKNHSWARHRTSKTNCNTKSQRKHKNPGKFRCGLCNVFSKSYEAFQIHKRSATHQILFRRNLKTRLTKSKLIPERFKNPNRKQAAENQNIKNETQNISENLQHYRSDQSDSDSTDKDGSSVDSCSSSSHDESKELDKIDKKFYCHLDECKSTPKTFKTKILFEEHKKLHKRGHYNCNFCDKVESTAIKLSLHECEMHSVISAVLTNIKTDDEVFHCARCAFESKHEAAYFNHFGSVHLGIFNAKLGKIFWECDICKKKLINRKRSSQIHFKTHHDTKGIEDPEKQIKRCNEDGCAAHFLSTEQLRIHKETQHLHSEKPQSEDDSDTDTETIEGPPKCKYCDKICASLAVLQMHKRKYHSRKTSDKVSNIKIEYTENVQKYKRLVCPELKCTNTFPSRLGLETHKKFHGTFPCNFCEHVANYAPTLASHEYEMHLPTIGDNVPINSKLKPIQCVRCPKAFETRNVYEKHFLNVHLGLSTIFVKCSICEWYSNSPANLHSHYKRNHLIKKTDSSKIFKCNQCSAYFIERSQLICHKRKLHNNDDLDEINPLKCKECDKQFRTKMGLKIHSKVHTKKSNNEVSNMFYCALDNCKQIFYSKISLERHQKLHERARFKCQFCDSVCDTVIKLIKHENTNHSQETNEEKLHRCSRCSYKNKFVGKFQIHFAEVHLKFLPPKTETEKQMPGKFECQKCPLEFSYGSDLAVHEAQHNKNTGFRMTCPRCRDVVTKKTYLKHFLHKHLGNLKRKICPICNEQTVRMDAHYKHCHKTDNLETNPKIYKCEGEDELCKAYFIKAEQLIRHKRKMHVKEWKCKECGKKLKNSATLKIHTINFHPLADENPELPFKCCITNCKKRFGTTAELDCHRSRHKRNNESFVSFASNQFKCEKCDQEFVSKTKLQGHIANAHSERSFICPECGKMFKFKSGLDNHLLYHSGPSSWKFQCSICGKKCATKETLASHMNTHTKEKSWVCQFCGNKYAHQHNWKNHILAKHGNEDNVPKKREIAKGNHSSRKGTKKGDCILAKL